MSRDPKFKKVHSKAFIPDAINQVPDKNGWEQCLTLAYILHPGLEGTLKASPEKRTELFNTGKIELTNADGSITTVTVELSSTKGCHVGKSTYSSKDFSLWSPSFTDGGKIPNKFSCNGDKISPELKWKNVPEGTKALVLVCDDPDAVPVGGEVFRHWTIGMKPEVTKLPEAIPNSVGHSGMLQLKNDAGTFGYFPPCPPDTTDHHYKFTLHALKLNEDELALDPTTLSSYTKHEVDGFLSNHTIETAVLVGVYNTADAIGSEL